MHFLRTALALSATLLPLASTAPTMNGISRAEKVIDSLQTFLDIIDEFPTQYDAWDYKHIPGSCSVRMYTHGGANCKITVQCNDHRAVYEEFNVCYIDGQQYFTDPKIGDFSITFRGVEDETLGIPELRISSVDNGVAWDVPKLADEGESYKSNAPQRICNRMPEDFYYDGGSKGGEIIYECGVPKQGEDGPNGRNFLPVNDRQYAPGWCGMHVTQHQKPNPETDQYKFDVKIYDANEQLIGELMGAEAGAPISMSSRLPNYLVLEGGRVDADAVLFKYGSQTWNSKDKDHHCKFGGYESNKREGDCGFTC